MSHGDANTAAHFKAMHAEKPGFIMPNAWEN